MTGLRVDRTRKDASGKRLPSFDPARELANSFATTRELVVELLSRMALHRRDRRDLWYDASSGKDRLSWLKESFEKINNGRHEEVSLPNRIDVVVDSPLLGLTDVEIRLIDTKGLDGTSVPANVEDHFHDPHTVVVLCSRFNDAPADAVQRLLQRARDSDVRGLRDRTMLLVLPHAGEAMEVKDEAGIPVATVEDGYDLKQEQIELRLRSQHLPDICTAFFDAREEASGRLRNALSERVDAAREQLRETTPRG